MSDPLNPETNPNDNNNSVLRLTRLFWFEHYQQESGSEITRIVAGLPHANADSIVSILFSTGAEVSSTLPTAEVISSFDRTRRIFSYTPPAPIPKTNYIRLVAYNDKGDSVVFAKGGYVVPRMLMPGNTSHGVTLLVDPKSLSYIDGMELDYTREGLNEGFKFNNPNVKNQCGCGESFGV